MNNICTPATAARLKAAGFPQPDPAPGQFWYIEGALYMVRTSVPAGRYKDFMLSRLNSGYDAFVKEERFSGLVFAPGVADLLRELPGYDIGYYTAVEGKPVFIAFDDNGEKAAEGKSPAEVLAAAWLELHEGK